MRWGGYAAGVASVAGATVGSAVGAAVGATVGTGVGVVTTDVGVGGFGVGVGGFAVGVGVFGRGVGVFTGTGFLVGVGVGFLTGARVGVARGVGLLVGLADGDWLGVDVAITAGFAVDPHDRHDKPTITADASAGKSKSFEFDIRVPRIAAMRQELPQRQSIAGESHTVNTCAANCSRQSIHLAERGSRYCEPASIP